MDTDQRIEDWANYLSTVHWDNLDELAQIIVAEIDGDKS